MLSYRNLENLLEYEEEEDISETLGLTFQASCDPLLTRRICPHLPVRHVGRYGKVYMLLRSCSIGINRFWFDGLVGFFRVLLEKNLFRLVWLINFFNQPPTRLKRLKKHMRDYTACL